MDAESTGASVQQDGQGVIRLMLSPVISIEEALDSCRESLIAAVNAEFELLFADRDVAREYEVVNKRVIIRRA